VSDYNNNKSFSPLSQKELILQQIQVTSRAFSSFGVTGDTINAVAEMYDYSKSAQAGKSVANSVLTLEALVYPLMTKEFLDRKEIEVTRDKAFLSIEDYNKKHFPKTKKDFDENIVIRYMDGSKRNQQFTGKLYMADNLLLQQQGIENIMDYFRHLIAFIFSLDEFKEISPVNEEAISSEEEEFLTD